MDALAVGAEGGALGGVLMVDAAVRVFEADGDGDGEGADGCDGVGESEERIRCR